MFSKELMGLDTELKKYLGDHDFLSQAFDRKRFLYSIDYPTLSIETCDALCRFVLLDGIRDENKMRFSAEVNEIYNDDLKVGNAFDFLRTSPLQDAVRNAARFLLDSSLDKQKIYRLLAHLAVTNAKKHNCVVPAHILKAAGQSTTPVKQATEKTYLLDDGPVASGCCAIA